MKESVILYYDTVKDGDIKKMIDQLMKIESSPYFQRRSRAEIARLILIPALKKEIEKYKTKNN